MSTASVEHRRVVQHRLHQQRVRDALSAFCEPDIRLEPVAPDESLRMLSELHEKVGRLRESRGLRRDVYSRLDDAIDVFLQKVTRQDVFFELDDTRGVASGFFVGKPSARLLHACLGSSFDTAVVTDARFECGAMIDVVVDDIVDGNFFEVEWWY